MKNDAFGDRIKKYEYITRNHLIPRLPVIIRLDGKAFHQFTRGFHRPFDDVLIKSMQETMSYLCENIQGCVLGYQQSDEISLILVDYMNVNSSSWFDYNIQKCASVAASMATMAFNRCFTKNVNDFDRHHAKSWNNFNGTIASFDKDENEGLSAAYHKALEKGAMFDARVFNVPKEEVTNCIYWRQADATRNSINMVGRAHFSHAELMNKSCNDIQDMLMKYVDVNWNDFATHYKRGSCCIKEKYCIPVVNTAENSEAPFGVIRSHWVIDMEIPIFRGDGRKYVDNLVYVGG